MSDWLPTGPKFCLAVIVLPGMPFNPHYFLKTAVGNVISCVVFGHRFDYRDDNFQNLLRLDNEAVLLSGTARAQVTHLDSETLQ